MVPERWQIKQLKDIAEVQRGKFSARPRNDPRYYGGDIPFVQTGDIAAANTYLKDYSQTLNQEGLGVSKLFPEKTILITIAANIGDTAITTFDVACPDSLVAIQPHENTANVYWLKKVLETKKNDLDSQATQNAQKNINLQVLKPLSILCPPYVEQEKIARILSTWDKAIEVTEELLNNSQQQKKSLMQQLLTGVKRLPGFDEEWQEGTLGDLAIIDTGFAFKSASFLDDPEAIPIIRMSDLKTGRLDLTGAAKISKAELSKLDKFALSKDEFVFGMSGSLSNYAWIQDSDLPCYLNQRVGRIVSKESAHQGFVTSLYLSAKIQKSILDKAEGAAQLNISIGSLRKMRVSYPDHAEQKAIASILNAAAREVEVLKQKVEQLKQEKKALMQQLLTGKRRVIVDKEAAA